MDQAHVKLLENVKSNNNVRRCGDGNLFEHHVTRNISTNFNRGVIKSEEPINSRYNYFEVKIKTIGCNGTGAISIGVGDIDYPLNKLPGWITYGVGYHSDDGKIFVCEGSGKHSSLTCKEGDRMGCGIDFKESSKSVEIFFTKNGQHCCEPVKIKLPANGLYPMIGISKTGDRVQYLGHWHREAPINLLTAIKDEQTSKVRQWIENPECRLLFPKLDVGGQKSERYYIPESHVVEAFNLACSKGLIDIFKSLLNCELESDRNDQLALYAAVKNNKADLVTYILQRKKIAHLERIEDGYTAIMIAAENGCIEAFQILWKHCYEHKVSCNVKSDVKVVRSTGLTDKKESRKSKTNAVAEPNGDDPQSYSEIPSEQSPTWIDDHTDLASHEGSTLLSYDVTDPERAETIEMTQNPRIRNQLEIPMDLSEPIATEEMYKYDGKKKGEQRYITIMHLAVQGGHTNILEVMYKTKICLKLLMMKNQDGQTPLHLACEHGQGEMVQTLLKYLGSLNHDSPIDGVSDIKEVILAENDDGNTPAHVAAYLGHTSHVEMFIQCPHVTSKIENSKKKTLLHSAALGGHVEVMKLLIRENTTTEVNIDDCDENGDTPLHLVMKSSKVDAIEYLIKCHEEQITKKSKLIINEDSMSCLDVAIKRGQRTVVKVMLNKYDVNNWSCVFSRKTMKLLLENMPDIAEFVLNSCISSDKELYSEDCEVTFDYKLIECKHDLNTLYSNSRNKVLKSLLVYGRSHLLKHPLIQGLVDELWKKYWIAFYVSLMFHIVFVIFITSIALTLNNPTSITCQEVRSKRFNSSTAEICLNISALQQTNVEISNITDGTVNMSSEFLCFDSTIENALEIRNRDYDFVLFGATIIIGMSLLRLFLEFVQLAKSCIVPYYRRYEYFSDVSNWLEMTLFISAIVFATSPFLSSGDSLLCIQDWQWNVGTLSVLLAWSSLLVLMRKVDIFETGIYVAMLEILLRRIAKMLLLTSILVVMFALAFYMTMNQFNNQRYSASPFADPLNSIFKTMTMMTGEMDYESIFRRSSEGSEDSIPGLPFPIISYMMWIIFLIMIPILLSNMLIGLAVDDIKEVLKSAEVYTIQSKIDLFLSVDNEFTRWLSLLSCLLPYLCYGIYKIYKSKRGDEVNIMEQHSVNDTKFRPFEKTTKYIPSWFIKEKEYKSYEILAPILDSHARAKQRAPRTEQNNSDMPQVNISIDE